MMILYSGDLSPYSAKVRMQIYAMGVDDDFGFELPVVQFFSGKLKEVSPIGRIPILKTDEGLIPESEVIAEYIDELYPAKITGWSNSAGASQYSGNKPHRRYLPYGQYLSRAKPNENGRT